MTPTTLPLIRSQRVYSYPKEPDKAPLVNYHPLDIILTRHWPTDAHTTAYSAPHVRYRLSRDAVQFEGGVTMVLFVADIDGPDHIAPDTWWLDELAKLDTLRQEAPGAFIYRTRGGYRILYRLQEPIILASAAEVEGWRETYLSWIAALLVRFHIKADASCHDWQRLYRVPHATRTPGAQSENRETFGSPDQIGSWTCEPTDAERALAKTLAKRTTATRPRQDARPYAGDAGDGALYYAFQARGWVGQAMEPGKWAVQCPWSDQHTNGAPFNTSTVLWAPGPGEVWGWMHCSHAHCQTRDIRDVLRVFTGPELSRAKHAAGILDTAAPSTPRVKRMYAPWFGRGVKQGVSHAS